MPYKYYYGKTGLVWNVTKLLYTNMKALCSLPVANCLQHFNTKCPICSISMLVLFLPQLYWFGIMLKGGLKVICGKDTT